MGLVVLEAFRGKKETHVPHTTKWLHREEPQALAVRSYLLSGNVFKLSGTTVYLQQGGGGPKDEYRLEATCRVHSLLVSTESYYCIWKLDADAGLL